MQTIVAVRIDERLIHGQVATMWAGAWRCTRIIVIDDKSASDDVLKAVLKISCPNGIRLSVLTVDKAATNLKKNKYDTDRITIVCKNPRVLWELHEKGFDVENITVGNMSKASDKIAICKSVAVLPEDAEAFHKLDELGVKLEYQLVPSEAATDFMPMLNAALK